MINLRFITHCMFSNDDIVFHYDKKKLVPFGEFIPFRNFINFLKLTPGQLILVPVVKPSI